VKQLALRVPQLKSSLPSIQAGSWRPSNANSSERGYGWKWQQARLGFLKKHPICVVCEAEGRIVEATVVDHVIPHRGDQTLFWDRQNWRAICSPHHNSDAQKKDNEFARGER
jgi:5-methylcytosine-specific restriction protein A